jgi:hypothetical protein
MGYVTRVERFRGTRGHRLALLLLAALAAHAATAATYRIVVLPLPRGALTYPTVTAINAQGEAVGFASHDQDTHAIAWNAIDHAPRWLPEGTAHGSTAVGINDAGMIVGQLRYGGTPTDVAIWQGDAAPVLLQDLPHAFADAREINASGQVLGNLAHPFKGTWDTFWSTPSSPDILRYDYLHGPISFSVVTSLNDSGTLHGFGSTHDAPMVDRAFRLVPGSGVQWLGELPGVPPGQSYTLADANNAGQAVGDVQIGSKSRAVLWKANGAARDLGMLPSHPGFSASYSASRINDAGTVTGTYFYDGGYQAFVWTTATGMRSIADLIDRRDPLYPLVAEGTPITIKAINRSGAMAAMLGDVADPQVPILLLPEGHAGGSTTGPQLVPDGATGRMPSTSRHRTGGEPGANAQ